LDEGDGSLTQIKKQVGALVTASPLPDTQIPAARLMSALPPKADISRAHWDAPVKHETSVALSVGAKAY